MKHKKWCVNEAHTSTDCVRFNLASEQKLMATDLSLHAQLNFMLGELKTLADSSLTNEFQNKAFKDMVSKIVWNRYNYMLEVWGGKGKIVHTGGSDGIAILP